MPVPDVPSTKSSAHTPAASVTMVLNRGNTTLPATEYSEDIASNNCQSLCVKGSLFSVMCPCTELGHKMTWDCGGGKLETRSRSSGVCRSVNFGVVVGWSEQNFLVDRDGVPTYHVLDFFNFLCVRGNAIKIYGSPGFIRIVGDV